MKSSEPHKRDRKIKIDQLQKHKYYTRASVAHLPAMKYE